VLKSEWERGFFAPSLLYKLQKLVLFLSIFNILSTCVVFLPFVHVTSLFFLLDLQLNLLQFITSVSCILSGHILSSQSHSYKMHLSLHCALSHEALNVVIA